jgi:hypothetical protein
MAVVILATASTSANALFGKYLPLNLSGSLSYGYGYFTAGGTESETTNLIGSINASGYVWQPWFATTSAALSLGLSNTETTSSSSDSTQASGNFSLSVFPRSRFPFSLNYSRSDSRIDSFSNMTQVSGDSQHRVSRLTLRQIYEGRSSRRSIGSRTSVWFSSTNFNSNSINSDNETMGLQFTMRLAPHSFSASASHSTSSASDSLIKPVTDVASLTHAYIPDSDLGVTSLATVVKIDNGLGTSKNTITQVSSNFYWRPEHRAVNVSGGVRVSESETLSEGVNSERKSLNTNLGLSYRLTRRISMGASMSLGTSHTGNTQTLSTSQAGRINYSSRQVQISGFSYNWGASARASNSAARTDDGIAETSTSVQGLGGSLAHSATRRWIPGKGSSLSLSLSQSGNMNSSSESDTPIKGLSHRAGLSWNRRGRSGALYGNLQVSDSRSYGQQETEFQHVNASISQDVTISRLSRLSGTVGYTQSQQKIVSDVPGASKSSRSRTARANFSYRHDRPFGFYNMNFTSRLSGRKLIDSFNPETLWDWDNRLRYRLGLLDTSLALRIIESAGGTQSKSLSFQATRSF